MKKAKTLIALFLCCVMLLSLMACGTKNNDTPDQPGNSQTGTNNPGSGDKENSNSATGKDELRIVISQDSGTLDPAANNGWDCIQALRMIYEPLWEITDSNEINFVLATGIDVISPTKWHVHLREGVTFQNGNPFTAEDVLFTITRANTRTGASALLPKVLHEECSKIDDYTVEIVFDSYRVGLMQDTWSSILIQDAESFDENTISSETNGTGPYEISDLVINSQWTLTRRDNYWGDPAPFKTLIFQILTEDTQKVNALETGAVDICNVPFQDISYVESLPNVNVLLRYDGQTRTIYFNLDEHTPFHNNEDARKAVALAVDRQAVINIAYSGYAVPSRLPVAQGKFDQVDSFLDLGVYKTGQDLEEAKRLAESSGLAGREITVINNGSADAMATCELIQDNLKKIGVTCKIWTLDAGSWKTVIYDAQADWDFSVDFTMGSSVVRGYDMWSNLGGGKSYADNDWRGKDRFYELKPVALEEPDDAVRTPMVQELTEILTDSLIWYSICDKQQAIAYNKDLKNFQQRSDGYVVYTNLSW